MRGIYRIRNVQTGDCYVGKGQSIETRWTHHRSSLASGSHYNHRLQEAWDTYGSDAFAWEVIEEIAPPQGLNNAEALHIAAEQPVYNLANAVESKKDWPRWDRRRMPELEMTTVIQHTACPECRVAINIERRIYPGLGQIIEISYPPTDDGDWRVVATRIFREDGSEVLP